MSFDAENAVKRTHGWVLVVYAILFVVVVADSTSSRWGVAFLLIELPVYWVLLSVAILHIGDSRPLVPVGSGRT